MSRMSKLHQQLTEQGILPAAPEPDPPADQWREEYHQWLDTLETDHDQGTDHEHQ